MLVTNRDCIIADFCIKSYEKIYNVKKNFGYNEFTLYIYLNNLNEKNKDRYLKKWSSYPFTFIYDNAEKLAEMAEMPYPGQIKLSPEGIPRNTEDFTESCDDLWTSEPKKLTTPYIALVDADFEILDSDFYFALINRLANDQTAIGASSCYSASSTTPTLDSYSGRYILYKERNHTWFCIYKKEAFERSQVSHFYFEERTPEGQLLVYDSAAYFQHSLRQQGYTFLHSPPSYFGAYVHYGASSKNQSLNSNNISLYRKVFILTYKGIFTHTKFLWARIANSFIRKVSSCFFGSYLSAKRKERGIYVTS